MENITLTQIQFDRAVFKIEGEFSGFNIDMLYFRDAMKGSHLQQGIGI